MSRVINLALVVSASSIAVLGLQVAPAHATTATSSEAQLVGKLGFEGGAYPGKFHPTAGTVEVEFDGLTPLTLVRQVGPSGHFEIPLPAGMYTVIGCGPSSPSGASSSPCSKPANLTLSSGEVDHIKLVWALAP